MHTNDTSEPDTFEKCIAFLHSIGIRTIFRKIDTESFLPGFLIEQGMIVIDRERIQQPGDILHEAGHIAVVPSADRQGLTDNAIINRKDREAEEVMAIAWSYAACIQLEIDPGYVFHDKGYRGGSDYITESCHNKSYIGLHILQGVGMTADNINSRRLKVPAYPYMIAWLRK